jgi:DNA-binding response OmpR family regulator
VDAATILVVDDNRLVRELIRDVFTEAGYGVVSAPGGAEALERLEDGPVDLIITDVAMPDMDGWAFCEAVKEDPRFREIPLVFLASHREVPERLRGFRLGAYDYLCKPFSVEELLVRARLILDRTRGAAGTANGDGGPDAARQALAGHTSHFPIADLLQLLSVNGKTGTLVVSGRESGRVHVREGRIVGAVTATTRGRKALYRMVGWTDADFRFEPKDDTPVADDLGPSAERLVMDALVALDDLARLREQLPPGQLPVGVAEGVRELLASPAALSPLELAVIREAREHSSLDAMLERIDAADVEIARAVAALLARGAIAPLPSGPAGGA